MEPMKLATTGRMIDDPHLDPERAAAEAAQRQAELVEATRQIAEATVDPHTQDMLWKLRIAVAQEDPTVGVATVRADLGDREVVVMATSHDIDATLRAVSEQALAAASVVKIDGADVEVPSATKAAILEVLGGESGTVELVVPDLGELPGRAPDPT